MSTALASARRRRAGPEAVAPPPGVRQTVPTPNFPGAQQAASPQPNMGPGLTLPQVIALVDKRLTALESVAQKSSSLSNENEPEHIMQTIQSMVEEYNARFDIIADEIGALKDTVMKLQTYTMEVNKTLMQERIRILSNTDNDEAEETSQLEEALNGV